MAGKFITPSDNEEGFFGIKNTVHLVLSMIAVMAVVFIILCLFSLVGLFLSDNALLTELLGESLGVLDLLTIIAPFMLVNMVVWSTVASKFMKVVLVPVAFLLIVSAYSGAMYVKYNLILYKLSDGSGVSFVETKKIIDAVSRVGTNRDGFVGFYLARMKPSAVDMDKIKRTGLLTFDSIYELEVFRLRYKSRILTLMPCALSILFAVLYFPVQARRKLLYDKQLAETNRQSGEHRRKLSDLFKIDPNDE